MIEVAVPQDIANCLRSIILRSLFSSSLVKVMILAPDLRFEAFKDKNSIKSSSKQVELANMISIFIDKTLIKNNKKIIIIYITDIGPIKVIISSKISFLYD